jgi:hypothetical protein
MAGPITRNRRTERRELTRDELYAEAQRLGVKGRSTMTKSELEKAIRTARG